MLEKTTTATTAERVALPARDVELGLEEAAGLACKHFRWLRKLMRPDMLHDWATNPLCLVDRTGLWMTLGYSRLQSVGGVECPFPVTSGKGSESRQPPFSS
jgi:hypothetical protein